MKAYIPENPNKVWVTFCKKHNTDRLFEGCGALTYYEENQAEIDNCPHCNVEQQILYYACYNFAINLGKLSFDYHCPYPVGRDYFGDINKYKRIHQMPNENSIFLFGHESSDSENKYAISYPLMQDIRKWAKQYKL